MKALVKNLGDQFNVPVDELENLNIDKFVDDAIKVQQGEIATLREDQIIKTCTDQNRDWMNSNYWKAIESGSMHYVDDDDLVTLRSNRTSSQEYLLQIPLSHSFSPNLVISGYAPCVPTPVNPFPQHPILSEQSPMAQLSRPTVLNLQNSLNFADNFQNSFDCSFFEDKLTLQERWSEEAKRRYEQYQQTWERFRTTKRKH
ncbi:unnamed protein product [Auanema sp. JU1783]|nr:unnamed protein product [Auanema sp. JU1783]